MGHFYFIIHSFLLFSRLRASLRRWPVSPAARQSAKAVARWWPTWQEAHLIHDQRSQVLHQHPNHAHRLTGLGWLPKRGTGHLPIHIIRSTLVPRRLRMADTSCRAMDNSVAVLGWFVKVPKLVGKSVRLGTVMCCRTRQVVAFVFGDRSGVILQTVGTNPTGLQAMSFSAS